MTKEEATPICVEYFAGHAGAADFASNLERAKEFAQAQCPFHEIMAAMELANPQWPMNVVEAFCALISDEIGKAADAAKALMRLEIMNTMRSDQPSAAKVSLLKEFGYQHLDWSRKPIDAATADALREAEKELRSGKKAENDDE